MIRTLPIPGQMYIITSPYVNNETPSPIKSRGAQPVDNIYMHSFTILPTEERTAIDRVIYYAHAHALLYDLSPYTGLLLEPSNTSIRDLL